MDPERWAKVVELFHAARERTGAERAALLDSHCSGSHSLRVVVDQMLRDDEESGTFLNRPATEAFAYANLSRSVPVAPSARFGHYEIVAPIGRGGMGEVWAARDTELGRLVALKFLSRDTAFGEREDLIREARAASALNHPNILTVHEVIRHEDMPIIAMELVEGAALPAPSGIPQPVNRVIQLGEQIARGLAAAHIAGLIHGDIKPANILVRKDGYVKIVDFGLAGRVAADPVTTSSEFVAGTPRYMSPEQARGDAISPASDVFSFGLVLYELVTGQHAFPGDSPFQAVQAMLMHEPSAASSVNPLIPARLDSLIRAMLHKDPAARPSAEEVERELGASLLEDETLKSAPTSRHRGLVGQRFWLGAVAAALIVSGVMVWLLFGKRNSLEFAELRIQPLTSQAGWARYPAFSSDGRSIAFTWTERLDALPQIYVKQLNESEPVRLTDPRSDGEIGSLVWSPDGSRIAFKRAYKESGAIFSIRNSGGDETKLLDLEHPDRGSGIDWSPDGALLAFAEPIPGLEQMAVFLFNLRTGEKRRLTSPPPEVVGDHDAVFSPDGRTVAFKRVGGFWADDLYVVPTAGGVPRRVAMERRSIWGHAWTADGESLVVSCQRGGTIHGLWRFPLTPQDHPERIVQGGVDAITPVISRRTNRVAWLNLVEDLNIYRVSTAGGSAPVKLIASTVRDQDASSRPDGRIAFVSDRSGSREIWIATANGSSQVRITNFNGPDLANLQWSPNGQHLAFDGRVDGGSEIFSLDCDSSTTQCGSPRRVISAPAEAPSWSADGESLYFASRRTGRWEVWKQRLSGGVPTQITRKGGYAARESQDGKWLYFSKDKTIWRIPAGNSAGQTAPGEEFVVGPTDHALLTGWTLIPDEIVYIDATKGEIRAYRISTKETRLILKLTEGFRVRRDTRVSVSPDLRWVLYSQLDRSGSNVMMAEKIH